MLKLAISLATLLFAGQALAESTGGKNSIDDWIGIYAESTGFDKTALRLRKLRPESIKREPWREREVKFDYYFSSDSSNSASDRGDIDQSKQHGTVLIEGDVLYLPHAHAYPGKDDIKLGASIERLWRVSVGTNSLLMSDQSYQNFQNNKTIGGRVLVKISDDPNNFHDLSAIESGAIPKVSE